MGAKLNDEDRLDLVRRLFSAQKTLKKLMDYCEQVAAGLKDDDASGLAFAVYMIRESLSVYSLEMAKYMRKQMGEDDK